MTTVLGAADLRRGLTDALEALRTHRNAIDGLNVYPVPDADTGTNLVMTFEAIAARVNRADGSDPEIARLIRTASLMGARGNSGVIVAQIVRAWADAVEAGPIDVDGVARAFKRSVELAYEAVLEPAEGTILSVLRAGADAAQGTHADVAAQLAAATRAAEVALAATREQMPLLARAGVVDAGGAGLVVVLGALARALGADIAPPSIEPASARIWECVDLPLGYAYEVMYALDASDDAIPALRELLGTIGDSVAVIGGGGKWRVHVHTDDRRRAVAIGEAVGRVEDVRIVSFADQIPGARGIGLSRASDAATLIAVTDAPGVARLFAELGAVVVADEAALRVAISRAPTAQVIVLPNDARIRTAALALAAAVDKAVTVLPADDPASGIAAAVAFGDARAVEESVEEMRGVLASVRAAAVDDGADPMATVEALLEGSGEVITLLAGASVDQGERDALAAALRDAYPGLAIEMHDGGQVAPRYLLAVE